MRSEPTKAVATRLSAAEAELLEEATAEVDWTTANLVRRAIRYYVEKNPDDIVVLHPEDSLERFVTELME